MEWVGYIAPLSVLSVVIAVCASVHALLFKRETRTTIAWMALIWFTPFLGSLLYVLLGVNRLRRKGGKIQSAVNQELSRIQEATPNAAQSVQAPPFPRHKALMRVVEQVTELPLLPGNLVTPLRNGDEAYPAMLEAINQAQTSITMMSYIFDNDRAGREFLAVLESAVRRGVEVRVLIDDVGSRYTRPTLVSLLERHKVPCARFLPTRTPFSISYANLRNHRKILVVDGRIGFTGGMNIRERCRLDWRPKRPVVDLHFRFEGPVVTHLQEAFAADWSYTTDEQLDNELWFPSLQPCGETWARGIPDGPDEDLGNLPLTLQGAIATAQETIDIVTPYFLPDPSIAEALIVAAMRGVTVRIVVPQHVNIRVVQWASASTLEHVLNRHCQVYATPDPFDHSKIMLVDDVWCLVGSSNWDPRSLRLNFEFNVECYDKGLNRDLTSLVNEKISSAKALTLESLQNRPLLIQLRDQLASLLTPYL